MEAELVNQQNFRKRRGRKLRGGGRGLGSKASGKDQGKLLKIPAGQGFQAESAMVWGVMKHGRIL